MLHSLEIRNYRNLRHLTIEKLGRVNLLVGKNNTGKTSVLEAVYLWANYGRFDKIYEILEARDGLLESGSEDQYLRSQALLASLFTNRVTNTREDSVQMIFCKEESKSILELSLRFIENKNNDLVNGHITPKRKLVFEVYNDLETSFIEPSAILDFQKRSDFSGNQPRDIKNEFVRSNEIRNDNIGTLFDEIVTTDWEDEVVNALKIVDSRIFKLAFLTDTLSRKRYPVVRLEGSIDRLPLRSMGDGINRILTIILAMVNCENGYLLIDEFENGLHYSVQEKLWDIIFYLAERLNIQVFATTHSNDTIKAFGEVVNSKPEYNDAQLIRLRNIKGEISAVSFSANDIEIANETDYIDLR